jgi:glycerol uptake facilitator-like aquaporin
VEASGANDPADKVVLGTDGAPVEPTGATEVDVEAVAEEIPARGVGAYVAEFTGTFTLVLFITMVYSELFLAPVTVQQQSATGQIVPVTTQPFIDLSVIGLVHVFVLFMLIQTLAVISGAHFNPAVTAALAAIRQIRAIDAAIYIVVQLAGGVLGALVTKLILAHVDNAKAVDYGAVKLSANLDKSIPLGMLVEGLGAFFLVFAIVGVAVNPQAFREWAGLVIGGTLGLLVMVSVTLTTGSFNPARAFGSALAGSHFDGGADRFLLVWVLAPLIGAVLAAFAYMRMFVLPGKKGPFGMGPVG